jgi:predicted dithiol-disulfide oxidoreductase (DUF899 family)
MPDHPVATREDWLAARLALLDAEKEVTRRNDEVARQRQALPWVRVDKDYRFDSEDGEVTLPDLFRGRSQLIVQHFMYGPDMETGCPSCSSVADGWDGFRVHLENHDVAMAAVSRAPIETLAAYKHRMGWSFPWVSSARSDFNFDFAVSFTSDRPGPDAEYNYRPVPGTPPPGESVEAPGVSTFALAGGDVYHCYSAYARGLDALWGMWQWLDRAPLGRNEDGWSFRRHDEYPDGG